jgi:DNA-binding GntR family transcriptional regulator
VSARDPADQLMPSGEGFRLDAAGARRITAVDLVRDTLRTAILRGDLPGGSQLVQTEIATRLGVSTTPVREAMRDLASEGLITMDSHRIGTVRSPDWAEMEEIVEIRRSLEAMALRLAMEHADDALLEAATVRATELAGVGDLGTWVQKNIHFHSLFHRATATKRLATVLTALEEAGGVFVAQAQRLHPEIRQRAIDEHFALIEAFSARDLDRALEIQHGHLQLPLEAAGKI